MTEHADPHFPVIVTTAPTGLRSSHELVADSPADLAGSVLGLCLRYGGVRDLVFRVRADGREWTTLTVMAGDVVTADPDLTVGGCRTLCRRRWPFGDLATMEITAEPSALTFRFSRKPGGLWSLRVHAGTELAALRRVSAHTVAFCRAGDEQRLGAVRYLTDAELALVAEVNDTGCAMPEPDCMHQLVESTAEAAPDRVAVIRDDVSLSYRELDEKANALAHRMISLGVGLGSRVGIVASRSVELVVATLAVLKTGAAYVPLDPLLPRRRREVLHRLGKVDLVLAEAAHERRAEEVTESYVVIDLAVAPDSRRPASGVTGQDLAYVIFTSGSSGEPKGVLLDHAGRANMILDLNRRTNISAEDRVLAVSSPSFDMTVTDTFAPLAAGGAVVLPGHGLENDVSHWCSLVARHRVTIWHSVPSSLTLFLNAWRHSGSPRLFMLGGDWIPLTQIPAVRRAFPRARVISLGGATEVSVDSVFYDVDEVDPRWRSIPYGRPMGNQTAYVLDSFGELAGIDQVGELYLGGAGVGWGYESRPGFTASRFVPNPYGFGRLYRTGDLARLRPSGELELLGRADHQVKVGGVRVELGEIEACLRQHPSVTDAVVVPLRDKSRITQSLVAYLCTTSSDDISASVRAHLAAQLPASMIPTRFEVLDELPVNQNGKTARGLLEEWATEKTTLTPTSAPDDVVAAIGEIWCHVLALPTPPAHGDSFRDLGGNSLAAIQVVSRLNRKFGTAIKVSDFVNANTISHVAAIVASRSSEGSTRPPLVPEL